MFDFIILAKSPQPTARMLGQLAGAELARRSVPGLLTKGVDAVSPRIMRAIRREVDNRGQRLRAENLSTGLLPSDPDFWTGFAEGCLRGATAAQDAARRGRDVTNAIRAAISAIRCEGDSL